jgi:hypothetical protein
MQTVEIIFQNKVVKRLFVNPADVQNVLRFWTMALPGAQTRIPTC